MSLNVLASTLGTVAPAQDEAHFPPTSEIFWQPLFSVGPVTITRPMVVVALSVGLLAWWLLATTKRAAVVPSKGQFLTEGIGRADVWVFDVTALGNTVGGVPISIVTLFADTPRALAVSNDGNTVYVAAFNSGNRTTTVNEGVVCNGGAGAGSCRVPILIGPQYPGGLPAPNANVAGQTGPETGLIVKFNGSNWVDQLGRNWNNAVRFSLPDFDVFAINATATTPAQSQSWSGVGTTIFNRTERQFADVI